MGFFFFSSQIKGYVLRRGDLWRWTTERLQNSRHLNNFASEETADVHLFSALLDRRTSPFNPGVPFAPGTSVPSLRARECVCSRFDFFPSVPSETSDALVTSYRLTKGWPGTDWLGSSGLWQFRKPSQTYATVILSTYAMLKTAPMVRQNLNLNACCCNGASSWLSSTQITTSTTSSPKSGTKHTR